jgi:hypothetical protein
MLGWHLGELSDAKYANRSPNEMLVWCKASVTQSVDNVMLPDTKYARWFDDTNEIQGWHFCNESVAKRDANVMLGWHLCELSDAKYANVRQCDSDEMQI